MILRRVIEHFRKQEWTAIFLDFAIVVIGILIAFQITEWNEARRNKTEEVRYRQDLAEDLRDDISEFEETAAAAVERVAATKAVLDELGISISIRHAWIDEVPEDIPSQDAIDASRASTILDIGHTRVLDGHRSTFDELVGTGNLGVLTNRSLVRSLTRYYAAYEADQDGDEINRHYQIRLFDYYQEHGLSQHDEVSFENVIEMTKDPAFLGHIKVTYFLGLWQIARTTRLKRQAEEILALVDPRNESDAE